MINFVSRPNTEPHTRRVKRFAITPEMLVSWLLSMHERPRTCSASGLPPDARLVGGEYDNQCRLFRVYIESETFPLLHLGAACEDIEILLTDHPAQPVSA